jgi:hypothetical protein
VKQHHVAFTTISSQAYLLEQFVFVGGIGAAQEVAA